jgi:outer membrane protein insertion porin family
MKRMLILAVGAGLAVVNLVGRELPTRADTPPREAAPANPDFARQGKAAADAPGTPLPAAPRQEPQEMVAEVRIEGNQAIGLDRILTKIRTRPKRPYLEEQIQEDILALYHMGFAQVRCLKQTVPGGVAVTFQVVERRLLKEVIVLGSNIFRTTILKKEAELKAGDAADPQAVKDARRRIEEYYLRHGFENVDVTAWEGDKEGDLRAVFVVKETPPWTIPEVNIVGNHAISSARLAPYSSVDELDRRQSDEDVMKLTAYYRSFGFFLARVGSKLEFDEKQNLLKITFVIDEGPRYFVRNVSIQGAAKIDRSRLEGKLKLLGAQPYDLNQQILDEQKLRDEYGGKGYVFAGVDSDNRILEEPAKLDIVYNIKEGARYRIGRITIRINGAGPQTQDTVRSLLSFEPGDIADTREFLASEQRLKAAQFLRVEPQLGIEPKIVYRPPEPEAYGPATADRTGEPILDVEVRAELKTPDADSPPQDTP